MGTYEPESTATAALERRPSACRLTSTSSGTVAVCGLCGWYGVVHTDRAERDKKSNRPDGLRRVAGSGSAAAITEWRGHECKEPAL